jgi:hypothetical protein
MSSIALQASLGLLPAWHSIDWAGVIGGYGPGNGGSSRRFRQARGQQSQASEVFSWSTRLVGAP